MTRKQILQVVIMMLIVAAAIILFLFPEVVDNRYEYSYRDIEDKTERIESLEESIASNENTIEHTIERLALAEYRLDHSERLVEQIRLNVDDQVFKLDTPSILIELEQSAYEHNIELEINYNSISTSQSFDDEFYDETEEDEFYDETEDNEESQDDEIQEDEHDEGVGGDIESEDVEEGVTLTEADEDNSDSTIVLLDTPQIDGINVTTIPISISGSYSNVRSYVRYLGEIGMIEPHSVVLESEGREITGSIILNVFHGEGY